MANLRDLYDEELRELIINKFDEKEVNYGVSRDRTKLTYIDDSAENVIDGIIELIKELT